MKRLPDEIRDTFAPGWGLAADRLTLLGGGQDWSDGTLFTGPTPGGDLVLKVLDFPRDDTGALERAEERIGLIGFFGDQGCRTIVPQADREGRLFRTKEARERFFLAYAYPLVEGRVVHRDDPSVASGAYFRAVGTELGRLHAAWAHRPQVLGPVVGSPALKGWRDEMAFFRSWCRDEDVGAAWDHLTKALGNLAADGSRYGFVHNDAHVGNFLFAPDRVPDQGQGEPELTIIDFDVANYHWYLNDCAAALYSFGILGAGGIETPEGPPEGLGARATQAFWEGYSRHRDPALLDLDLLDLFLQYRRCLLFMPFQEQTARDPAWRHRWTDRIVQEDRRLFS